MPITQVGSPALANLGVGALLELRVRGRAVRGGRGAHSVRTVPKPDDHIALSRERGGAAGVHGAEVGPASTQQIRDAYLGLYGPQRRVANRRRGALGDRPARSGPLRGPGWLGALLRQLRDLRSRDRDLWEEVVGMEACAQPHVPSERASRVRARGAVSRAAGSFLVPGPAAGNAQAAQGFALLVFPLTFV